MNHLWGSLVWGSLLKGTDGFRIAVPTSAESVQTANISSNSYTKIFEDVKKIKSIDVSKIQQVIDKTPITTTDTLTTPKQITDSLKKATETAASDFADAKEKALQAETRARDPTQQLTTATRNHKILSSTLSVTEELKSELSKLSKLAHTAQLAETVVVQQQAEKADGVNDIKVLKPISDKREFHFTKINGLKALLISDAQSQKAAYAMSVGVGSLMDPPGIPGLAHFTEHMLFLGSKKYPAEGYFSEIMDKYDGENNAYTDQDITVYFNDIHHSGLEKGLDTFAQFFVYPTFNQSMASREVHAVNQEHEKNIGNQPRRMWELLRGESVLKVVGTSQDEDDDASSPEKSSSGAPVNPLGHFFTGNLETLETIPKQNCISLSDSLRNWYDQNYCKPRMNLVILANRTISELEILATEYFSDVKAECSKEMEIVKKTNCDATTNTDAIVSLQEVPKGSLKDDLVSLEKDVEDELKKKELKKNSANAFLSVANGGSNFQHGTGYYTRTSGKDIVVDESVDVKQAEEELSAYTNIDTASTKAPFPKFKNPDATSPDNKNCPVLKDMKKDLKVGAFEKNYPTPYPSKVLGYRFVTKAVSTPQVWLMFPLGNNPVILDLCHKYEYGIQIFLSYLFSDSGPHSLKTVLKKRNLISDIGFWLMKTSAGSQIFLMFDLTEQGDDKNVIQRKDGILETVFGFLNSLNDATKWNNNYKDTGEIYGDSPPEMISLYKSIQSYVNTEFKWSQRSGSEMNVVSNLAKGMTLYEPSDILAAESTIKDLSPCVMRAVLQSLNSENMNMGWASKSTVVDDFSKTDVGTKPGVFHEKYYDILYQKEKIEKNQLTTWFRKGKKVAGTKVEGYNKAVDKVYKAGKIEKAVEKAVGTGGKAMQMVANSNGGNQTLGNSIQIMSPLKYIPSETTSLIQIPADMNQQALVEPKYVAESNLYWSGLQPHLQFPKAQIYVKIEPVIKGKSEKEARTSVLMQQTKTSVETGQYDSDSPSDLLYSVMRHLHSYLVSDLLESQVSDYASCGIGYSFSAGVSGWELSFHGWNEHLLGLIEHITPQILNPLLAGDDESSYVRSRFDSAIDKWKLDLENVNAQLAVQHGMDALVVMVETHHYDRKEYLTLLQAKSKDDLFVDFKQYLKRAFLREGETPPVAAFFLTQSTKKDSTNAKAIVAQTTSNTGDNVQRTKTLNKSDISDKVQTSKTSKSQHKTEPQSYLRLTTYFIGNMDIEESKKTAEVVKDIIVKNTGNADKILMGNNESSSYNDYAPMYENRILHFPQAIELRAANPIPGDSNDATIKTYQFPRVPTIEEKVKLNILGTWVQRASFEFLRTKHQLGYIVQAEIRARQNIPELIVLVQGTSKNPDEVSKLIDQNWSLLRDNVFKEIDHTKDHAKDHASEMTDDTDHQNSEFEKRKLSFVTKLKKPSANQGEEGSLHWNQISSGHFCFQIRKLMIDYSENKLDSQHLLELWDEFFATKTPLTVKLFGSESIGEIKSHTTESSEASDTLVLNSVPEVEEKTKLFSKYEKFPTEIQCQA